MFEVKSRDARNGKFVVSGKFQTREQAEDFIRSLDQDGFLDLRNHKIVEVN